MKSKVTSTKNKKIAEDFSLNAHWPASPVTSLLFCRCKRNNFASVFPASQCETVGKCMWNIAAVLCKYSPFKQLLRQTPSRHPWYGRSYQPESSLLFSLLPFLWHKKWLLQQSGCDTDSQSSIHNAWNQIPPLTWGMAQSPPAFPSAIRPSLSRCDISGLESIRRRSQ